MDSAEKGNRPEPLIRKKNKFSRSGDNRLR